MFFSSKIDGRAIRQEGAANNGTLLPYACAQNAAVPGEGLRSDAQAGERAAGSRIHGRIRD
nr:hypothetical protein [uncultured Acetatifactor sp.]